MRRTDVFARLLVGVVLVFGFAALRVSSAAAQDVLTATITIHKAECPTGVGGDIFEECHGNTLEGVDFVITDTDVAETYTTDADGVITATVTAGAVDIGEDPDVLAGYLGAYVYCSDQNTDEVFFDGDLDGESAIAGDIEAGADVVCDWYNITEAADDADDDADDDDSGGGTTLPSTGIGTTTGTGDTTLTLTLALLTLALGGAAFSLRRRTSL
jgi:hypothetical protein